MRPELEPRNGKYFIFISMPMKGISAVELSELQSTLKDKAIQMLKNNFVLDIDAEIVVQDLYTEPFDQNSKIHANPNVYHLGNSIRNISESHVVFFNKGWGNSRGCCIEHDICVKYGIPICVL